mmetsp:Transcript_4373/g.15443  ORF Transcript_4373/g.15443 Transcript_4373/m.15443 type:complete len:226 (-) Transcript_4373:157-834(-)
MSKKNLGSVSSAVLPIFDFAASFAASSFAASRRRASAAVASVSAAIAARSSSETSAKSLPVGPVTMDRSNLTPLPASASFLLVALFPSHPPLSPEELLSTPFAAGASASFFFAASIFALVYPSTLYAAASASPNAVGGFGGHGFLPVVDRSTTAILTFSLTFSIASRRVFFASLTFALRFASSSFPPIISFSSSSSSSLSLSVSSSSSSLPPPASFSKSIARETP